MCRRLTVPHLEWVHLLLHPLPYCEQLWKQSFCVLFHLPGSCHWLNYSRCPAHWSWEMNFPDEGTKAGGHTMNPFWQMWTQWVCTLRFCFDPEAVHMMSSRGQQASWLPGPPLCPPPAKDAHPLSHQHHSRRRKGSCSCCLAGEAAEVWVLKPPGEAAPAGPPHPKPVALKHFAATCNRNLWVHTA